MTLPATSLDIEKPDELLAYLRQAGHIAKDETPVMQVLAGGVSNRTVLVQRDNQNQNQNNNEAQPAAWVLKQALAKLRVKVDWFSDPARVHREAMGLRHLKKLVPQGSSTPLLFEDQEHHLLAMAAVPQPHDNWKDLLLAGHIEAGHIEQFGQLLGHIHKNAFEQRDALATAFADRSFFQALRLEPYYTYTAKQLSPVTPYLGKFFDQLCRDTLAAPITLVHGDYSPKNILVHQKRLVLLDHEVIHWGDPAFDIGFSLAHLLSKAHHLTAHRQQFAHAVNQYWHAYRKTLGDVLFNDRALDARAVRHTLACLLARVAGRSTLEYLSEQERQRQQAVVTTLIAQPVLSVEALTPALLSGITREESCP